MRVRKNATDGNTQYYYDGNNNLIALCYTPTTGTKKVLNFFYDSEGSPIAFQINSSEKYYYIKNLQGDITKIINVSGETLVSYTYDAWGNVLSVTDNSTNNLSTLSPFRYRGYAYDTESGLYYLQSRYYDPQTGRFLNADVYTDTSTGTPLSTNMFAYCENCAVMYVDYTGKAAYWLHDYGAAAGFGHTSLLIQQSKGKWWYFYWGHTDIQLLYFGAGSLKQLNEFLHGKNKWKYKFYDGYYDDWAYIKGNFRKSLKYIFHTLMGFSKIEKMRSYSFMYADSFYVNDNYDLFNKNCVQVSIKVLLKGKLGNNKNERILMRHILKK